MSASSVKLLDAATAAARGTAHQPVVASKTFQALGATSAGVGAASVDIQVSNVVTPAADTDVDWITIGNIALTLGTTQTTDGLASDANWRHVRAKLVSISGTNASVSVYMGC